MMHPKMTLNIKQKEKCKTKLPVNQKKMEQFVGLLKKLKMQ